MNSCLYHVRTREGSRYRVYSVTLNASNTGNANSVDQVKRIAGQLDIDDKRLLRVYDSRNAGQTFLTLDRGAYDAFRRYMKKEERRQIAQSRKKTVRTVEERVEVAEPVIAVVERELEAAFVQ